MTIFAAMGITRREADYFRDAFAARGRSTGSPSFLNLADDPAIERLLTPTLRARPSASTSRSTSG